MLIILCILLVTVCYYFLDRPIADFNYQHHLNHWLILKYFTGVALACFYLSPFLIIYLVLKKILGYSLTPWQTCLLLASICTMITYSIKDILKFVFGRYWPSTWTNNNPSWLSNHAYGFHFFHLGSWYQSFPSGHTTIIVTFMSVIGLQYPKLRLLVFIPCLLVIIGLLAMNYHFLSDIIAGAFLGFISAYIAVQYSKTV
ncbi:MAG: hypothetical protein A3E87_08070 [Gammaproteobacteria bacterium RIFCSPHIGHO2_12_FULL_35_23]|nr:MAG: hypothetical protein A3E87_08070 [Gammaproteobacteria bacterium RIFCSPHIGHO2_12_FULL_35_23]